jgi:hypothetical protein
MKPKRLSSLGIENKIQMSKYIQLLRRKLILHMKKMETAPSKAVAMSTKAEGSKAANKRYCTFCRKVGHDDAYCFNNPNNPNNQLSKTEAKGTVAVNEVLVHS